MSYVKFVNGAKITSKNDGHLQYGSLEFLKICLLAILEVALWFIDSRLDLVILLLSYGIVLDKDLDVLTLSLLFCSLFFLRYNPCYYKLSCQSSLLGKVLISLCKRENFSPFFKIEFIWKQQVSENALKVYR